MGEQDPRLIRQLEIVIEMISEGPILAHAKRETRERAPDQLARDCRSPRNLQEHANEMRPGHRPPLDHRPLQATQQKGFELASLTHRQLLVVTHLRSSQAIKNVAGRTDTELASPKEACDNIFAESRNYPIMRKRRSPTFVNISPQPGAHESSACSGFPH